MSISDGEAHQRPPNGSTNAPPLSSATAGISGKPPIFNVPNHPTIHPASSCHSVTAPDLSKPPHRPEAHPRSQVWTHSPLHKSGQQQRPHHQRPHHQTRRGTYLGMRGQCQTGNWWREDRVDFHEAVGAIHQVIVFVQSLPHVMNNCRNMEHCIWQHGT